MLIAGSEYWPTTGRLQPQDDIYFPVESEGICKYFASCRYVGTLGDGYCPKHWDRLQQRYHNQAKKGT